MENYHNCQLGTWEVAQCPKLRSTFKQILEKAAEIDFRLREKLGSLALSHDLRMWVLDLIVLINEIPPMVGDLGFDYKAVIERHQAMLDALRVPELFPADLAALKELSYDI